MKIEIGAAFPAYFQAAYPGEFDLFSHFEVTASIPQVLFAITTYKANGKPNVCFHSWSCFHGDRTAFFAVMGGLYQHTHTYQNIVRDQVFCLNFLPLSAYDQLVDTIHHNADETDECAVSGFTAEPCRTIHAPAIREAFLNLECTLHSVQDLSGAGITAMVTGRVQHAAVEASYAADWKKRCGPDGFMLLVPAPQNLVTGAPGQSGLANLQVRRLD